MKAFLVTLLILFVLAFLPIIPQKKWGGRVTYKSVVQLVVEDHDKQERNRAIGETLEKIFRR